MTSPGLQWRIELLKKLKIYFSSNSVGIAFFLNLRMPESLFGDEREE